MKSDSTYTYSPHHRTPLVDSRRSLMVSVLVGSVHVWLWLCVCVCVCVCVAVCACVCVCAVMISSVTRVSDCHQSDENSLGCLSTSEPQLASSSAQDGLNSVL